MLAGSLFGRAAIPVRGGFCAASPTPTLKEPISASVHGGLAYPEEAPELSGFCMQFCVRLCAAAQCCIYAGCRVLIRRPCVPRQPEHFMAYARSMHVCIYVSLGRSAIDMALHVLLAGPGMQPHASAPCLFRALKARPAAQRSAPRLLQNGSQKEGQASRKRLSPAPQGKTEGGPREYSKSCSSVHDARIACVLAHFHKPEISRSRNVGAWGGREFMGREICLCVFI